MPKIIEVINCFHEEFAWLSNFFASPIEMPGETFVFATAEHAYQAAKCACVSDQAFIATLTTPGKAKRKAAKLQMREDWEDPVTCVINGIQHVGIPKKVAVMLDIVTQKFVQNPELAELLIATGDAHIEEGNNWGDRFWGVCEGEGENWLGEILVSVRSNIEAQKGVKK